MEYKRQEPGRMAGVQGGAEGHAEEQEAHKRIRALSIEVPGTEPMLSDPGEPHKCIESSQPERAVASGREQRSGGPQRGTPKNPLLGEKDKSQKKPLIGEEDESQKHPLLGEQSQSMENERQERERRKMEEAERKRASKNKPAA